MRAQSDTTFGKVLGAGGFGTVTAVRHANLGDLAAKRVALVEGGLDPEAPREDILAHHKAILACSSALGTLLTEARLGARLRGCRGLVTARPLGHPAFTLYLPSWA